METDPADKNSPTNRFRQGRYLVAYREPDSDTTRKVRVWAQSHRIAHTMARDGYFKDSTREPYMNADHFSVLSTEYLGAARE